MSENGARGKCLEYKLGIGIAEIIPQTRMVGSAIFSASVAAVSTGIDAMMRMAAGRTD